MKSTPRERVPSSIDGCLEACRRCEAVIHHVMAQEDPAPAWTLVGPHLRHCVEHFRLLLTGIPLGRVDYDARERDERLEKNPAEMREAFRRIADELASLPEEGLAAPLVVVQSAASHRPPASSRSCVDRELVFLSGHAIHHIAIMALAAASVDLNLPAELAVAFSTEAHRASIVVR